MVALFIPGVPPGGGYVFPLYRRCLGFPKRKLSFRFLYLQFGFNGSLFRNWMPDRRHAPSVRERTDRNGVFFFWIRELKNIVGRKNIRVTRIWRISNTGQNAVRFFKMAHWLVSQMRRLTKMRKTKIVCTLGPASSDRETLEQMWKAGMNVARLNFSHGSHEEHGKRISDRNGTGGR